ncbi:MAG: hypothetical protein ABH828_05635 [archaeon]
MSDEIFVLVRTLLSENRSLEEIRTLLSNKGFLASDIDDAIEKTASDLRLKQTDSNKKIVKKFALKEIMDRIGYGFVSHPFLNILFSFTGASYFIIGLINALRNVLSLVYSSFLKEFSKVHILRKNFISRAGVVYGFSFLIMSFAVVIGSPLLFSIAFLVGALGVVAHGELYVKFLRDHLKSENMGSFLSKISGYGLMITIISMLISGFVIDFFPVTGKAVSFSLFGQTFNLIVYGYLISFEITAFAFILSGYVLSRIKQQSVDMSVRMSSFIGKFTTKLRIHSQMFFSNKIIALLTLTSILTGVVQILGNSFYGIFIYNHFKDQFLGGFLNVAVIFSIAAVFSFIGPWFTRNLRRHIGISPMLVFGSLLTAMLPLSLAFNPYFVVVAVASALFIVGSSILGMAQGFFTGKLLSAVERDSYFSFVGLAVSLPILILVPLGAYLGQIFGLVFLFKILIVVLVLLVTPLYFLIVLLYERKLEKAF